MLQAFKIDEITFDYNSIMSPTKAKLYSILMLRCPRCLQGKFFESHPFDFRSLNHVKDRCSCCGLNYKIEPSFYFGSMYISYALGIVLSGATFSMNFLFSLSLDFKQLFGLITVVLVLLMPWIGAWSKIIWANIFMHYDYNISKNIKNRFKK